MLDEHSINGSSIQRRRQEAAQEFERQTYQDGNTPSVSSVSNTEENMIAAQINILRRDLLLSVALPFVLLVWLSGAGGLYCLTFGGIVCYILDLLESVEGTLISFGLTLLCFFGTVLFSVREFLSQSFLHFAFVPTVFLLICCVFFAVLAQFSVILSEFDSLSSFVSQLMLLLMPLLSSALCALVFALELPDYELSTLFVGFYFVYALYFVRPRVVCLRRVVKTSLRHTVSYTQMTWFSVFSQRVVYVLPVIVSLTVHYALHRRVTLTQRTRVLSLLNAVLQPTLLMLYCVRQHLRLSLSQQSHTITSTTPSSSLTQQREREKHALSLLTKVFFIVLFFHTLCVLQWPVLDEFKRFSGLREPLPTYALFAVCGLSLLAWVVQRRREMYRQGSMGENDTLYSGESARQHWTQWGLIFRVLLDVCVGVIVSLCALMVSVPASVLPIVFIAAGALCEFHVEESWPIGARVLLGVAAALGVTIAFVAFCKGTVYYLLFGFSWRAVLHHETALTLSIAQFCQIVAFLVAISALLPSLISSSLSSSCSSIWLRGQDKESESSRGLGLFAGNRVREDTSESASTARDNVRGVFSAGFVFIAIATACLELIVLEQNWLAIVSVPSEVVYPTEWLMLTAALMTVSGWLLHKNGSIGLTTLLLVLITHGGKLLVLWDVSSAFIVTAVVLGTACILPFLRQLSLYLEHAAELDRALSSAEAFSDSHRSAELHKTLLLSNEELIVCVVVCALSCVTLGRNVANMLLSMVLHGDLSASYHDNRITLSQELLVVMGVFSGYCGCVFFVFHRHAKYIRSVLFGICLLSFLVAFEGFGVLMITSQGVRFIDANAVSAAETATASHDHSMFFLVLSSLMTVIAWAGFVSLHDLLSCLVYSVLFGFVTAKATIHWTFPLNPSNPFLTHSMDTFAFQYLMIYKCLGVFVSLWNPRDRVYPAILQQTSYLLAMVWPLIGLAFTNTQMSADRVLRDGVIWSALVGTFNMTLSFRAKEVLNFLRRDSNAAEIVLLSLEESGNKRSLSLVFVNTLIVLTWAVFAMVLNTSALDYDLFLPVVALLLFACEARALPFKTTPAQAWCMVCVLWWYGSVIYHVLVRGYGETAEDNVNAPLPYSMFGWDEEVSFWTSPSLYLPVLNFALSIVPYPAILMALRRQRSDTEEMLFVLALLSAVALIGGSVDCVRYLGLMGVVAGGYRCYEINKSKKIGSAGNRYI